MFNNLVDIYFFGNSQSGWITEHRPDKRGIELQHKWSGKEPVCTGDKHLHT